MGWPRFPSVTHTHTSASAGELLDAAGGGGVMAADSVTAPGICRPRSKAKEAFCLPASILGLGIVQLAHLHFPCDYLMMARGVEGSDCSGLGHVPTHSAEVLD